MARLIMWNLVSLDGYFEGPSSDLSFMEYAWGPELELFVNAQSSLFGTIVFGRKTFLGMEDYWSDKTDFVGQIMSATPKVVFSRSLSKVRWQNSRIATGDLRSEVERIKQESERDAYVLGSATLCAQLARENLLDEYRIGLVSMVLGKGTHLFRDVTSAIRLKLIESRPLGDKVVLLRYESIPAR